MSRKLFANENSGLAVLKIIDPAIVQIQAGKAHLGIVNKDGAAIYKYQNFNQIEKYVENAKGVMA